MKYLLLSILLVFGLRSNSQILTQQISNHPVFSDVERFVDVTLQQANSNAQKFEFWFTVRYMKDSIDVSGIFKQPSRNSIYTDASTKQLVRDSLFNPIPNPEFDPDSFTVDSPATEYDMYLWVYGWDMIMTLINQPTNISAMIRQYILINDEENFFDN